MRIVTKHPYATSDGPVSPGSELTLSDEIAKELIEVGYADEHPVDAAAKQAVSKLKREKATAPKPETPEDTL